MAAVPESDVIVTPATRDEPLPSGEERTISYLDQDYTFPSGTTDDEMFEFLDQIPAEEEEPEEPSEPLREEAVIKKDEGAKRDNDGKHISYRDSEKHLTGGIGHKLDKKERKLYPKGTVIEQDVVDQWFKDDMEEADTDLTQLLEEKAVHVPDEVFDILLNMSFNLGKKGLKGFKKMWSAIQVEDWSTASMEMQDSKWFGQVKQRAIRLVNRMKALAPVNPVQPVAEMQVAETKSDLTPSKGGLFEDDSGKLFMVDAEGNKTEV